MDQDILLGQASTDGECILEGLFEVERPLGLHEHVRKLAFLDVVRDRPHVLESAHQVVFVTERIEPLVYVLVCFAGFRLVLIFNSFTSGVDNQTRFLAKRIQDYSVSILLLNRHLIIRLLQLRAPPYLVAAAMVYVNQSWKSVVDPAGRGKEQLLFGCIGWRNHTLHDLARALVCLLHREVIDLFVAFEGHNGARSVLAQNLQALVLLLHDLADLLEANSG